MEGRLKERGQSLFEILIAISVTAIVVGSAVTAMVVSTRSGKSSADAQKGYAVLQETLSMARAYAESDWSGFYNYSPERVMSTQQYYFATATTTPSSLTLSMNQGTTTVSLVEDNTTVDYTTWFTIENMYRDGFNAIATSPLETKDPSTLRVTAYATWEVSGDTKEINLSQNISRTRSNSLKFSQWDSNSYASSSPGLLITPDGGSIYISSGD